MAEEVLTVRIDRALADRLDQLVRDQELTREELLVQAVREFVDEQSDLIAAIKEGEADFAAGRFYTQEEVEAMFNVRRDDRDAA